MRFAGTTSHGRRGSILVEFAICIPIVLMLLIATAELSRALMQYNVLTKTIRDAARYVASNAFHGSTGVVLINAALRTEAANLVVYGNAQGTGTPILPGLAPAAVTLAAAGPGDFTVSVAYTYRSIFAFVPMFGFYSDFTTGYQFRPQITMRAL